MRKNDEVISIFRFDREFSLELTDCFIPFLLYSQ
jgi:hypothetical protein